MTTEQAAKIAGCSSRGIRMALKSKKLMADKNGRDWDISMTALDKWMQLRVRPTRAE